MAVSAAMVSAVFPFSLVATVMTRVYTLLNNSLAQTKTNSTQAATAATF